MSPGCTVTSPFSSRNSSTGDDAFRLVADVDDHFGRGHLENGALDDLAFRDVPEAVIVRCPADGHIRPGSIMLVVVARQRFDVRCDPVRSPRSGRSVVATPPPLAALGVFSSSTFAMPCASSCVDLCNYRDECRG